MRVAIVELLDSDVPPKVAINEAIEIVREFGGGESSGFVNGVLDFVHKGIQGEKEDSKKKIGQRPRNDDCRALGERFVLKGNFFFLRG